MHNKGGERTRHTPGIEPDQAPEHFHYRSVLTTALYIYGLTLQSLYICRLPKSRQEPHGTPSNSRGAPISKPLDFGVGCKCMS